MEVCYEDAGIFEKYLGGTAACMKILPITTKWCGQLTLNYTYFSDIWFSSVKMAEDSMASRVDYCGPVKTIHKGFCLDTLDHLIKYWPGGSYPVMKSHSIVPGSRTLLDIG